MSTTAGLILVIDDDDDIRDFVSTALLEEGYEVIVAANGIEALELMQKRRPGLILLDVLMPRMDGWDFLTAHNYAPGPRVPVIVLTAMRNVAESFERAGVAAFLSKPFELEDLLALVAVHIEPARAA